MQSSTEGLFCRAKTSADSRTQIPTGPYQKEDLW